MKRAVQLPWLRFPASPAQISSSASVPAAQFSPAELTPAQRSSAQLSAAQPSSAQLSLAQPSSPALKKLEKRKTAWERSFYLRNTLQATTFSS